MKCPVCDIELRIADRQGVEIDYCPKCRGIWLDKGELDKIIERSLKSYKDYDDYYKERDYDEYYKSFKYKKKKRFWDELFDFD